MTRDRPYSDSQLDALAAVRQHLDRAQPRDPLTAWRAAAHHEAPSKLHQKPTAEMGVDLAEQLARYIDGSAGAFPVHDALLAWDRTCRRRHRDWPDHRGRPVCAEMVRLIIFGGASLLYCSEQLQISYPRAERLLKDAGRFMRDRQTAWLAQTEQNQAARHDVEGCHECLMSDPVRRKEHDREMCGTCRKADAA